MEKSTARRARLLVLAWLAIGVVCARATELRTFGTDEIGTWDYPDGLVDVDVDGVSVRPFTGPYNAMSNTDAFASSIIGEHGVKTYRSPSNEAGAPLMGDQDLSTWWKPNADDPVDRQWVEIDLGRCVAATSLRVIFPDTVGARPFSFFSVYVSPGIALRTAPEQIRFTRVGRPVSNNTEKVVDFDLYTVDEAVSTGQYLVTGDTLDIDLVRFVRFEAGGITQDAAVAEIEVQTIGVNLATRVTTEERAAGGYEVWGGETWTSNLWECDRCGRGSGAEGMIDGDLGGRYWTIEANNLPDWRTLGCWQVIDMRHTFRINRMVWVPNVLGESPFLYGFDRQRQAKWQDVELLYSDGSPSNVTVADAEGPYDYTLLSEIVNNTAPLRWLFDLQFPSTDMRVVMWRRMNLTGSSWHRALQLFMFPADGYPKEVVLESGDIDLGGAFSVQQVVWDADLPPNTSVHVETQTGNGYQSITRYYLVNGIEVTQAEWEATKKRNQGPIVTDTVRDPSWSAWSLPHVYSGQAFQSPTPRRWARLRVRMISDDPSVMPVLHSVSFVMNSPVIAGGVSGHLEPRMAALDSLQTFRYTLWPNSITAGDDGFDRVIIRVPDAAQDTDVLRATVGGEEVSASGELRGDSLIVDLDTTVRSDSVVIDFQSRVYRSPTVFETLVYNSTEDANIQGVAPSATGMDLVFLPEVETGGSLLRNVRLTGVFTPNGDGVNDALELSLNVINTSREPEVQVYSLDGRQVATLVNAGGAVVGRSLYAWNGRDGDGGMVPPGLYVLRMRIKTDARDEVVYRLVHVVY